MSKSKASLSSSLSERPLSAGKAKLEDGRGLAVEVAAGGGGEQMQAGLARRPLSTKVTRVGFQFGGHCRGILRIEDRCIFILRDSRAGVRIYNKMCSLKQSSPIILAENLTKVYSAGRIQVSAVRGVSLEVERG